MSGLPDSSPRTKKKVEPAVRLVWIVTSLSTSLHERIKGPSKKFIKQNKNLYRETQYVNIHLIS